MPKLAVLLRAWQLVKHIKDIEPCVQLLFDVSYRETGVGSAMSQLAWGFMFYASGKNK